ncbi:glycosyltransferase family 2 protein [Tamlana sp. I1]|uniref:glycosyltransferase family 2 protein n=1 Tax=Tamlana sp. I1 TaxID=2762061 RepID=UPI00188F8E03|nr:glycosyltransferase family 2 protein [Tamlana sp. I1]
MNKSVTVIIVTYNGMPWLPKCLKSCDNYPVVVVDNASTDGTVHYIKKHFPEVTLLEQNENKGFGQANNIGIRHALGQGADYVFLLNQDAYLVDSVLEELIGFHKKNEAYGILSPLHITGDSKRLDHNFSNYMFKEKTGQFYSDFVLGNPIQEVYDVPFVNAAAWLISKKCLETIGGFDPLFFHYGEDDNYCQRVLYHGFKIGVLPKSYIIHDRGDRKKSKVVEFSEAYYSAVIRSFKLKHANLLTPIEIDKDILKLKKAIFKLMLQGRFQRVAHQKKTLKLMMHAKSEILNSRVINATKSAHYLGL